MKTMVVVAKGPSAFEVIPNDKVDVSTINNAIWMCPNPTYSFFNDVDCIWLTKKEWFKGVKTMIVPTYLNSRWGREEGTIDCKSDETHFYELSKIFPGWLDHINFQVYALRAEDNTRLEEKERTGLENSGVESLDEWPGSTGGTSVSYCSKFLGYKDFILAGFDAGGGYHPKFIGGGHPDGEKGFNGQGTAPQPSHLYPNNWNITVRFAERYGARVRHINDVSQEEREELGI
mgnify:CR=1 FL=1|jgi:hypothetical protein